MKFAIFCINSIKIPIVMRIFANTIYSPQLRAGDKGHLYASLGVFPAPAYPLAKPQKTDAAAANAGNGNGRAENGEKSGLRWPPSFAELSIWRQHHLHSESPTSRNTHPLANKSWSRSSSSCWGPCRNEMQFKCLGYKLLSQQAAGSSKAQGHASGRRVVGGGGGGWGL